VFRKLKVLITLSRRRNSSILIHKHIMHVFSMFSKNPLHNKLPSNKRKQRVTSTRLFTRQKSALKSSHWRESNTARQQINFMRPVRSLKDRSFWREHCASTRLFTSQKSVLNSSHKRRNNAALPIGSFYALYFQILVWTSCGAYDFLNLRNNLSFEYL
jgi:hypothetical protein